MTFTTFVMFDMFNALCCRSADKTVLQMDMFANKAFLYSVGGSLVGQVGFACCFARGEIFIGAHRSLPFSHARLNRIGANAEIGITNPPEA